MEAIFSLPYSEFEAINRFNRILKKKNGFGIFIPVSRQQKGCDFLILGPRSRKPVRVQVKSSRAYTWDEPPLHRFWYRNFASRYRRGDADIYALTCHYPEYVVGRTVRERLRFWQTTILIFTDAEMARLLPMIRGKGGNVDTFFSFGFNDESDITFTRGSLAGRSLTSHLLTNRVEKLKRMLG
jgi:hypothetical protein